MGVAPAALQGLELSPCAEYNAQVVTIVPFWCLLRALRISFVTVIEPVSASVRGTEAMESGTTSQQPNLDSILRENRVFPPPAEFAAKRT